MTTALAAEPLSGFQALALSPKLLAVLNKVNYLEPHAHQAALIPFALAGRDVIARLRQAPAKPLRLLPFLNSWEDKNRPGPRPW